ncbi:hypothetical protein SCYAM73S_01052 [Streptomyces cyaneofuscatus]
MHETRSGGASRRATAAEPAWTSEFLALERELTVFLRRARASPGEMAREVHPDLEPAAYGLLVRLEYGGRQRATELAAYFGVGKATMTRQLRALENLGLVAREPDPADGRAWLVRPHRRGPRPLPHASATPAGPRRRSARQAGRTGHRGPPDRAGTGAVAHRLHLTDGQR